MNWCFAGFAATAVLFAVPANAQPSTVNKACLDFAYSDIGIENVKSIVDLRRFAPIRGETRETEPSVYFPGQNNTFYRLYYPGLTIKAVETPELRVLISQVEVTGGNYKLPLGLKIGAIAASRIESLLGRPTEVRSSAGQTEWVYNCTEDGESPVSIFLSTNRIVSVVWNYGGD